jgi:1-acyl-sn-glycerol-3-phosphate acyltransferase
LLRVTLKSARLIPHLLYGLLLAAFVAVTGGRGLRRREALARHWHRDLLRILGIRLHVRGTRSIGPRLIAANHVSWLDIPVVGSLEPVRFVSKAEVRQWPLAGWLATAGGTFYLQRGAGGTRQLILELAHFVRGCGVGAFFPEGTTTTGENTLRFQPRLFAAAIEGGCMVQPVALRYSRARSGENVAAFVGDDDLVSNLLRLMREPGLDVEITFCTPIQPHGMDRSQLALAAQTAVRRIIAPATASQEEAADSEAMAA